MLYNMALPRPKTVFAYLEAILHCSAPCLAADMVCQLDAVNRSNIPRYNNTINLKMSQDTILNVYNKPFMCNIVVLGSMI